VDPEFVHPRAVGRETVAVLEEKDKPEGVPEEDEPHRGGGGLDAAGPMQAWSAQLGGRDRRRRG